MAAWPAQRSSPATAGRWQRCPLTTLAVHRAPFSSTADATRARGPIVGGGSTSTKGPARAVSARSSQAVSDVPPVDRLSIGRPLLEQSPAEASALTVSFSVHLCSRLHHDNE